MAAAVDDSHKYTVEGSMQSPLFSIITINFNNCAGLKRTMQSVFSQIFDDFEYIIIDGGSTDGSKEYIAEYQEKVDYWISEKDSGIYNAMNKGIRRAKGQLVMFLNSGDYYISPNLLSYFSKRIEQKRADLFFSRFIWDNPKGNVIAVSDNSNNIYDWNLKNSNFPHPATFYKKTLFEKIGLFDENFRILGDFDWNARALITHRIPFQYIDLVSTLFIADGVSNNEANKEVYESEMNIIINTYFQPSWLFRFIDRHKESIYSIFLEKTLGKVFRKRLNKVY